MHLAGIVSHIIALVEARLEIILFNKSLGTKERTKSFFSHHEHSRSQFLTPG